MKTAIIKTETLINIFKKALKEYEEKVKEQPTSTFYIGLVKNTTEYIKELEINGQKTAKKNTERLENRS